MAANKAYQQNISSNPQLFYEGNVPKGEVYFQQFAVIPLYAACTGTGEPLGALILTSKQDDPFAPDVLDTMAFFGSIIASYLYSYQTCYFARLEAKQTVQVAKPAAGESKPAS